MVETPAPSEVDTAAKVASPDVPQEASFSVECGDNHQENLANDANNQEDTDLKSNISDEEFTEIMEIMAATGKFWHDWDVLKGMLLNRLEQVLAEYPESQMKVCSEPEKSLSTCETYPELVKRMEEALLSFTDGPPFTLQRLCEILLAPKNIYPKLSKLALALEKNLLVTSTLNICTDPYPGKVTPGLADPTQTIDEVPKPPTSIETVISCSEVDTDEEMIDASEGPEDNLNKDIEMEEDKAAEVSGISSGLPETDSPTEPCQDMVPVQSTDTES